MWLGKLTGSENWYRGHAVESGDPLFAS